MARGAEDAGEGRKRGTRVGPFGLGDLPAWLGLIFGVIALGFSGFQFALARKQSEQTQKALNSTTASAIYQEDRDVWARVTPDIYDYFNESKALEDPPSDALKKARIVAGAMLDHFENVRFQVVNGAMRADRASWEAYIVDTFEHSKLLCEQFDVNKSYYGGGGPGTIGVWARQGCS